MKPKLQRIAEYLSTRNARSSIDPVEIAVDLLPHLYVLEIERNGAGAQFRLRIRLSGTALDRALGRCVSGHYMEEFLHGPRSNEVLSGFRQCATTHEALWMRQVVHIANRMPRYVEGVAFYVEPDLIYGGLEFGEIADRNSESGFESRKI